MLIVQSFWPGTKEKNNIERVVKLATTSHKFIKKHNFRSLFYIDKKLADKFAHIPYDEVRYFKESDFEGIYNTFWSAGKLIAAAETTEPYFHIDLDVFLFTDQIKKIENEPFMCLHSEPWLVPKFYDVNKTFFEEYFPELADDKRVQSYNYGIFGGQNYKLFAEVFQEILEFSKTNHAALRKASYDFNRQHKLLRGSVVDWDTSVFLEQVISSGLIRHRLNLEEVPTWIPKTIKTIPDIYSLFKTKGVFHIWCDVIKKNMEAAFGFDGFLEMLESYYLYGK